MGLGLFKNMFHSLIIYILKTFALDVLPRFQAFYSKNTTWRGGLKFVHLKEYVTVQLFCFSFFFSNLFRESAVKGRLVKLGLSPLSLIELSKIKEYEYLQRVIATKANGALLYDPMNQKASSALFSCKTADGLRSMGDTSGASLVLNISNGIIGALDTSGRTADQRARALMKLKDSLELNSTSVTSRIRRPSGEDITNELYQMTLVSIDSHIFTSINMEFFHPRRKSTATVEQLFGQLTMMTEGGSKLNCAQFREILKRLMLTNSTRLVPMELKGFTFLTKLGVHMKSYTANEVESCESLRFTYPTLNANSVVVKLNNSPFDEYSSKRKTVHGTISGLKDKDVEGSDVNPRKFIKRF